MKAIEEWIQDAEGEIDRQRQEEEEIEARFDLPEKRTLTLKLTLDVHEDIERLAELLGWSKSAIGQSLLSSAVSDAVKDLTEHGYLDQAAKEAVS